jgi:ABC-type nitrate/sulfonate/bicarbonate transport system permease component
VKVPVGLVLPLLAVVAAEAAMRLSGLESDTVAAPSHIARAFVAAVADGSLPRATGETLGAAATGLALGGGLGLLLAVVLGLSPALARLLRVPVDTFRPIPSVALIPIALLAYGFGFRMEIAIVAFACFWPLLIIGQAAIAGVEPRLLEVGRVLRLSPPARVRKIVLPAALPRLFVAFRLAAGVSLIVAVTVEITTNPIGLGYGLMLAQSSLDPARMFAFLLWLGLVGWGVNRLLLTAQRRLFGAAGGLQEARP